MNVFELKRRFQRGVNFLDCSAGSLIVSEAREYQCIFTWYLTLTSELLSDDRASQEVKELREAIQTRLTRCSIILGSATLNPNRLLFDAITTKKPELLQAALAVGADVNCRNREGVPVIIVALQQALWAQKNDALFERLMDYPSSKMVDLLLEHPLLDYNAKTDAKEVENQVSVLGAICLEYRIAHANLAWIQKIIAGGADVNQLIYFGPVPIKALNSATRAGRLDIVTFFLSVKGIIIDNYQPQTVLRYPYYNCHPLEISISKGFEDISLRLIEAGALPSTEDFYQACKSKSLETVRKIYVILSPDMSQKTLNKALGFAIENDCEPFVNYLLSVGAELDAPAQTPLQRSINSGNPNITHLLLARGANPIEAKTALQQTDLIFASATGNEADLATALQGLSDPINKTDCKGFTALMRAAHNGHLNIVNLLLQAGATVSSSTITKTTNYYGYHATALFLAAEKGHSEVVKRLLTVPNIALYHDKNTHYRDPIHNAKWIASKNGFSCVVNQINTFEETQKRQAILLDVLRNYATNRRAINKQYFNSLDGFFGGYSMAQKITAVTKLQNRLTGEGEQEIITAQDIRIFRQGTRAQSLANTVFCWERDTGGNFNQLVEQLNQNLCLKPDSTIRP